MFAISFTAGGLGMISAYLPDYMKSTLAAGLIFKMTKEVGKKDFSFTISQEPEIDQMTEDGLLPEIEGNVRFDGVFFRYPQRPETTVLQGLDIDVCPLSYSKKKIISRFLQEKRWHWLVLVAVENRR